MTLELYNIRKKSHIFIEDLRDNRCRWIGNFFCFCFLDGPVFWSFNLFLVTSLRTQLGTPNHLIDGHRTAQIERGTDVDMHLYLHIYCCERIKRKIYWTIRTFTVVHIGTHTYMWDCWLGNFPLCFCFFFMSTIA